MNQDVKSYSVITGAYWVFTLTDGALRTLILLHLHEQGYTPWQVASMFLLYEFFGVITSAVGGWVGARTGLKTTLFAGLGCQIIACSVLLGPLSLPLVMGAQVLSGIAKDLTKMSAKSYIKLVVPEGQSHGLMRWVALLTGSKNTLKGVGFFLGGFLLTVFGFQKAISFMIVALIFALLGSIWLLPKAAGKSSSKAKFSGVFSNKAPINWLAAARFFLFGSRDIWFVIAVPLYLSMVHGWSHTAVSSFLAAWIIGYGMVQALAPSFVGRQKDHSSGHAIGAGRLGVWTAALLVPLAALPFLLQTGLPATGVLIGTLGIYGVLFAANSAIHSYLIVEYAEGDKIAMRVGFYYMANAAGRLAGTVLSGALFQAAGMGERGLIWCVAGSFVFVLGSALICLPLRRATER